MQVLGIGGVFFKCEDPEALAQWYAEHLGFEIEPKTQSASFFPATMPPAGRTVWSVFPRNSEYFAPAERGLMINLVVDDLDAALRQVEAGGATRVGAIRQESYGRFGWFLDPEGNKVELWQPADPE